MSQYLLKCFAYAEKIFLSILIFLPSSAFSQSVGSLNISGILIPCADCQIQDDGFYRILVDGQPTLLRPMEARVALLKSASADQLGKSNKPGDLLRFILGEKVEPEEAEKVLTALVTTESGRTTFILSFESLYRVYDKLILKLLMRRKFSGDIVDAIRSSSLVSSDLPLEIALLALPGRKVSEAEFLQIVERLLDKDIAVTEERLGELQTILNFSELRIDTAKFLPVLSAAQTVIKNTSSKASSEYSEAGLKPSLRRIMRKQRLLTLTGEALASNSENSRELLVQLAEAYDPTLDSQSIHEAFRHLISNTPDAAQLLGKAKDELMKRDSTIRLILEPPPTAEKSVFAILVASALVLSAGLIFSFYLRRRQKVEEIDNFKEGLTVGERAELRSILTVFNLKGEPTLETLHKAFRKRAKDLHPDAQSNIQSEAFIQLRESYGRARELLGGTKRE